MEFIADLHIHSKYSRATSQECVPEMLDLWGRRKGIDLLGTGDFTHPAWRAELKEKLMPAEEGLYILRPDTVVPDPALPVGRAVRFLISGEISSIYKKGDKVRKVHNLILLPSLEDAECLSSKLETIGNLHSDGRPILGLDSRDLLEITLDCCPDAVFIPAHIWTPHFSLFGAFSGFDSIEECFGDLTPHIKILETGLSSDPSMIRRVSALDGYTLLSNSDAHSPQKLGREANLFDTALSFPAVAEAMKLGPDAGFRGTIEFFPEEGKYHLDGHRHCGVCLTPAETLKNQGRCPVCGKKITIGVQHRVEQLADRDTPGDLTTHVPFESLAPLTEVIAASNGLSVGGKRVNLLYLELLHTLGNEFQILRRLPLEDIGHAAGPLVEEGIRRLRTGEVKRIPGYDGEYGKIILLEPDEIETLQGQLCFLPRVKADAAQPAAPHLNLNNSVRLADAPDDGAPPESYAQPSLPAFRMNREQEEAATADDRTLSVVAGPGTGKTNTLVAHILHLLERGVKGDEITAVTFTNQAANELRERLSRQTKGRRTARHIQTGTFHSICLKLLTAWRGYAPMLLEPARALDFAGRVIEQMELKITPKRLIQEVSKRKSGSTSSPRSAESPLSDEAFSIYQNFLREAEVYDFDDLLLETLTEIEKKKSESECLRVFSYLCVDEFQDINEIQYRLLLAMNLNGRQLFAIGDPDQAIYGFRGSTAQWFERLRKDRPDLRTIKLTKNYRCTPEILKCALPLISQNSGERRELKACRSSGDSVLSVAAPTAFSEAVYIAKEINRIVGGIDMLDAQELPVSSAKGRVCSFSDIAILYRSHKQAELIETCLQKEGIPYRVAGREDFLDDLAVRRTVDFFRLALDADRPEMFAAGLRRMLPVSDETIAELRQMLENRGSKASVPDRLAPMDFQTHILSSSSLPMLIGLLSRFAGRIRRGAPRKHLEEWVSLHELNGHKPLEKLMNMSVYHKDMRSFLQNLLLGEEGDLIRSGAKRYLSNAVTLMTLHASKGLEFSTVFLYGISKGLVPLETAGGDADREEERRLFYVGLTRAEDTLVLLHHGSPSPFLSEIPEMCLVHHILPETAFAPKPKQITLF